jgi:hypothetical protein
MNLIGALGFACFLGTAVIAYGGTVVIDNFTCADSVSQTGFGSTSSTVSCPGSLGGSRNDIIFITNFTGSITTAESSVSTINSNPPAGVITGTIGNDLVGQDVITWFGSTTPGVLDLPNLDLSGDSILVQIESDSGGTLSVNLASGSVNSSNRLSYSAIFPASASFVDVVIPRTDPTVVGTGADVGNVTGIGLVVGVPA